MTPRARERARASAVPLGRFRMLGTGFFPLLRRERQIFGKAHHSGGKVAAASAGPGPGQWERIRAGS